jgi:putative signal transducing protein
MSADDVPEIVFEGQHAEVLFLKTLIESAGIETSLESSGSEGGTESVIYVRRVDVEHARELVEDFVKNGKRTDPW